MWFLIIFIAIIIGLVLYNKYKDNNNAISNTKTEYVVSNENILFELIEKDNLNAFIHWYENKSTYSNIKLNYECFDLLMYAIDLDRPSFVKYLIATGDYKVNKLYTNGINKYGVFPLAQAVTNGCVEIVKILLDCEDIIPGLCNKGAANIETFALVTLRGDQIRKGNVSIDERENILQCVEMILQDPRFEFNGIENGSYKLFDYSIEYNKYSLFRLYMDKKMLDAYSLFGNNNLNILTKITPNTSQQIIKDICEYVENKLNELSSKTINDIYEAMLIGIRKIEDPEEKEDALLDLNNNMRKFALEQLEHEEEIVKNLNINTEQKEKIIDLFAKVKKIYRKKIK